MMGDTKKIVINTKDTVTNTKRIAELLAGDEGEKKGAEYFRLEAIKKQEEVKALLRQVASSTVEFINTANNGNPVYVTNIGLLLASTSDGTINTFVTDEKALDTACESFKTPIKQAIVAENGNFDEKIKCTFTDTAKMDKFDGDFIEGGGWSSYLQVTTFPQNNIGAVTISAREVERRIEANVQAAELNMTMGNGFMSWEDCKPEEANWDVNYSGCTTLTPGSVIANAMNITDTTNMRQMEIATEYNDVAYILSKASEFYSKPPQSTSESGLGPKKIDTSAVDAARDSYRQYLENSNPGNNNGTPSATNPVDVAALPNSTDPYNAGTTIPTNNLPDTNNINNLAGLPVANNPYNADTTINFNLAVTVTPTSTTIDKDTALKLIDLQTAIEARYYNAQANIYKLLDATEIAFASSTATNCTDLIKFPIISQIQGTTTYDRTANGNLIWNKFDVASSSIIALNNITLLSNARLAVVADPNSPQSIAAVQYIINLRSMHSNYQVTSYSAGGYIFTQIKTWVVNKLNVYGGSSLCAVNKSPLAVWGIN
jgi:hypothetical protein